MIEKNYQPADIEGRMSLIWEDARAFKAGRPERRDAKPFTIVIPPPNVTGSLHMGHALNNTLQDVLCRFERMRGRDVLWQPGTDHAGIATQMVVERQLMERQQPGRRDMGREKFLERVWQWKEESGGTIVNQLKRLGASCDWSRERFTMDEGLSRAVVKVFVQLHREGLIYKDKRLVNWDPKLLTAISDLEVQQIEVKGHLWYLRYPIEGKTFSPDDPSSFIVVATTRPETMLGDTGVAVHPDDERYKHLVGKHVILPLVGRRIPIVADDYSDPEKGSGAVKVTPAHDFNDFEVGKRHDLPQINVLRRGRPPGAGRQRGLSARPARGREPTSPRSSTASIASPRASNIVERLENFGFLEKIEPNTHMVPHGDRSGVVIEPYLTDQWYVDAKTLAQPAIAAVRSGRTSSCRRTGRRPISSGWRTSSPGASRASSGGAIRFPAWYGPDGKVFVAETEEEAVSHALGYYVEQEVITAEQGREMALDRNKRADFIKRDEDVLDTWFSSALWPFSTLGWPDDTPEVKRYYPTDVLVTGLRHHLLLGRADDDDGPSLHEGGAVLDRLHPPARPRREGRQDVEVEGQRHRSARRHRRVRRRRAALCAGARRGAGPRHQAVVADGRDQPQLRDQALERLPLRRDERLREAGGLRSDQGKGHAEPLDRARDGARHARGDRGAGSLSLQRCVERDLSLRLERLLRLVSRARQADADSARRARPRPRPAPWSPGRATRS